MTACRPREDHRYSSQLKPKPTDLLAGGRLAGGSQAGGFHQSLTPGLQALAASTTVLSLLAWTPIGTIFHLFCVKSSETVRCNRLENYTTRLLTALRRKRSMRILFWSLNRFSRVEFFKGAAQK